jgi:hypothetical protein
MATSWSEAATLLLEGVINYVAFTRTLRRTDQTPSIESLIPSVALPGWRRWNEFYEALPVSDGSKDALAMHVASYVMNVPVYNRIEDLDRLLEAESTITATILSTRLSDVETQLLTTRGSALLREWERHMLDPTLDALPDARRNTDERVAAHLFLASLVPEVSAVHPLAVPESVALANSWTSQLRHKGLQDARIDISDQGYLEGMDDLLMVPAAQSRSHLLPFPELDEFLSFISSDHNLHALAVVHQPKNRFQFSRRYERSVGPDEVYIRCSFARFRPDGIDFGQESFFAIQTHRDAMHLLCSLAHPRIVVVPSFAGATTAATLAAEMVGSKIPIWQVWWACRVSDFIAELKAATDEILWSKVLLLTRSESAFWIVQQRGRQLLDVYPLPMEAVDRATKFAAGLPVLHNQSETMPFLITMCALITAEAF